MFKIFFPTALGALLSLGLMLGTALAQATTAAGPAAAITNFAQGTNRTCSPAPAGSRPLYLRGSMNGWTAQDDFEFVWDCDAWYLNVVLQGEQEFKLADGSWSVGHGWSTPQPGGDARQAGLTLRTDVPGAPAVHARFDGAHTLRVQPVGEQRVLQIQPQHFADPRQQPVTDPVALSLLHDSRDPLYRQPFGAVPQGKPVQWALRASAGVQSATLVLDLRRLEGNQEMIEYRELRRLPMQRRVGGAHEWFRARHTFTDKAVYGYWFEVQIGGKTYVYQNNADRIHWTQEKGSGGVGQVAIAPDEAHRVRRYRLTVYDPAFEVPRWAQGAVYYYLFPERFRNGNPANDPRVGERRYQNHGIERHARWLGSPFKPGSGDGSDAAYNNDFFGGDLQGIIDKLDDIKALGTTAIYMTPIFEAASNHKYDTADYHRIDPAFGSREDFQRLTREAARRGMRIVLDASLNHVGADSRYFDRYGNYRQQDRGAFAGGRIQSDSQYASWFTLDASQSEPERQYKGWVGVSDLPELDKASPGWRRFAYGAPDSVTRRWLRQGAGGWRMDVAPWVPDDFWREWRLAVKQTQPDAVTISEVWFDASKYLLGDTFDSTMNYVWRNAILDFAAGQDARQLATHLEHLREAYPPQALQALMNLISSHDQPRALHVLGDRPEASIASRQLARERFRLATLVQMSLPGAPTIYYGDEVGLSGGDDPYNRAPYPWADEGGLPDLAMRDELRRLMTLRQQQPVLRNGTLLAPLMQTPQVLVLARQHGHGQKRQWVLMAFNNSDQAQAVSLEMPSSLRHAQFSNWWGNAQLQHDSKRLTLTLPALGGSMWGTVLSR
jgi:glycosidase